MSQPPDRQSQGLSFLGEDPVNSSPTFSSPADASQPDGEMAAPGREYRRIETMPASGAVHRGRQEPVRIMEEVPSMQDEAVLPALLAAHGQGEGEEHNLCSHEQVCRHGREGLGDRAIGLGCLDGASAARIPQLFSRDLGPQGRRRPVEEEGEGRSAQGSRTCTSSSGIVQRDAEGDDAIEPAAAVGHDHTPCLSQTIFHTAARLTLLPGYKRTKK